MSGPMALPMSGPMAQPQPVAMLRPTVMSQAMSMATYSSRPLIHARALSNEHVPMSSQLSWAPDDRRI